MSTVSTSAPYSGLCILESKAEAEHSTYINIYSIYLFLELLGVTPKCSDPMTIFFSRGSPEEVITPRDAKKALDVAFEKLGKRCVCFYVCTCVCVS